MAETMAVVDVLEKINAEARGMVERRQKYPHVRDCTKMAQHDFVRQGDVYVGKLGPVECFDGKLKKVSPALGDDVHELDAAEITQLLELEMTEYTTEETWNGSRHLIVAPLRAQNVEISHVLTKYRDRLLLRAVAKYPDLEKSWRERRVMPAKFIFALRPWKLQHHEHARFDFSSGAFVVLRQLDLATQQFVID